MLSPTNIDHDNPRSKISYLLTYSICFVALGLSASQFSILLPYMADSIGVSLAQISFLFTASSLGYMTGSVGAGRLYDRVRSHRLLTTAVLIIFLIGILIPIIPWFYLLLVVIFIFGIGQGMIDIGSNLSLLWFFRGEAGPYMNALHFSFGVGSFLSPIIISNVMEFTGGSLTWPYWVLSMLFLPSVIGLVLLKSPVNSEKDKSPEEAGIVNYKLVALMMILFFLYVGVEVGYSNWIFTYTTELQIVNETSASYMTSIFWGALTLGRLLSIPLAKKVPLSKLLIGNFTLAVLFLGFVIVWPLNATMLWIGSAGLGLALSSIFPTLMALGETRMEMTGKVTSLLFFGTSLGGTIMSTLLGQIFEYIGSYQMMLTLFFTICLGLIFLFLFICSSNKVDEKIRN